MSSILVLLCPLLAASPAFGQLQFETGTIDYTDAPVNNRISQLQEQIDRGEVELRYDDKHGYLPAVLQQLDIPVESQMLVFSKTSFQLRQISPRTPRAVYFGDEAYIGWVQAGVVVEISTVDPQQGAIFYTLSQKKSDKPKFVRDRGQCLACHATSRTSGVPGHLVRSVYAERSGHLALGTRTFTSDHRSPFSQRWGGWYVSGTHGKQRHMGNVYLESRHEPEKIDLDSGQNITDLSERIHVTPYLSPHSDIVALMVLEHQSQMHNRITRANFEARIALDYNQTMNEIFKRDEEFRSDSTKRRVKTVSDRLLEYLLFVDEFELQDPVTGTSGFTEQFASRGPYDSKGRSLRDLDLKRRLMKHPCSYLIYSKAFDNLPQPVAEIVYRRLWEVLTGKDDSETFAHLSAADRTAILEILRETKTGLPDYWN